MMIETTYRLNGVEEKKVVMNSLDELVPTERDPTQGDGR